MKTKTKNKNLDHLKFVVCASIFRYKRQRRGDNGLYERLTREERGGERRIVGENKRSKGYEEMKGARMPRR